MFDTLLALAAQATDKHGVVYHGPPPWWPIFPIFWLLFIVVVAATLITLRRRRWGACGYGPGYGYEQGRSGLERLAERYAAGEIDEDEYRSRKAVLDEQFQRRP